MTKASPPSSPGEPKPKLPPGKAPGAKPPRPAPPKALPKRNLPKRKPKATSSGAPTRPAKSVRPAAVEPETGEVVATRYRLDSLVARGGMGAIWAGWDTVLDRSVAIKFMDSSIAASDTLRARFHREAKAAAKLHTPHVVQVYDHGVHGSLPFIVMELLEGEDLHDRLRRVKRLSPLAMVKIVSQIAKALRKAHKKAIVHRDLKPRNVFLASDEDDDEEVVKILDFGIAKNIGRDQEGDTTKTGQVLGSPNYMSPEQARGYRDIDHRTDLWSLAVILFRALTGRTLFRGESTSDVIVKICTDPLPKPSDMVSDLPAGLDEFFQRALAREPDDRYQSAMELAQAYIDVLRASNDAELLAGAEDTDSGLGQRLSTEWTPLTDLGTPPPGSESYPSMRGMLASGPGLTPTPSDPGSSQPSVASQPGLEATTAAPGKGLRIGIAAGAAALVLAVVAGLVLSGDETEGDGSPDTAAAQQAEVPLEETAAQPSEAPSEPTAIQSATGAAGDGSAALVAEAPSAEPTVSATAPVPPPVTAHRPIRTIAPKPPPTNTPTKTGKNWGY